jgi:hypothetical protein
MSADDLTPIAVRALLERATSGPPPPPLPSLDDAIALHRTPKRAAPLVVAAAVLVVAALGALLVRVDDSTEVHTLAAEGWSWTLGPAAPGGPRLGAATAATDEALLMWGGFQPSGHVAAGGAAYDLATDRWEDLPATDLAPRGDAAAAWGNGSFFLWGGRDESTPLADGATYDPATHKWQPLPPSPLAARWGAAAAWVDGRFVVAGGEGTDGRMSEAAAYDPVPRRWERLPDLPTAIGSARALAVGDAVYVFPADAEACATARWTSDGGWSEMGTPSSPCRVSATVVNNEVLGRFDDGDGTSTWMVAGPDQPWRTVTPPDPRPTEGAALVSLGAEVVVAGEPCGLNGEDDLPDVLRTADGSWQLLPAASTSERPRCGAFAMADPARNRVLFWGGGVANGMELDDRVHVLARSARQPSS